MVLRKLRRGLSKPLMIPVWLGRALSSPSMIPVWLGCPPPSNITSLTCSLFDGVESEEPERLRMEFLKNHRLFQAVNDRFIPSRHRRVCFDGWRELLYVLIRILKPNICVETGVFDGHSSAVILAALQDNAAGTLISIDLPATTAIEGSTHCLRETALPQNCQPGWLVPDYLKERNQLLLGDSKTLLPQVLKEHSRIDMFLHDSLHTLEHQLFEYTIAWPHLSKGGLLLSDDIFWTQAFHRFCKAQGKTYKHYHGFGVARKD